MGSFQPKKQQAHINNFHIEITFQIMLVIDWEISILFYIYEYIVTVSIQQSMQWHIHSLYVTTKCISLSLANSP